MRIINSLVDINLKLVKILRIRWWISKVNVKNIIKILRFMQRNNYLNFSKKGNLMIWHLRLVKEQARPKKVQVMVCQIQYSKLQLNLSSIKRLINLKKLTKINFLTLSWLNSFKNFGALIWKMKRILQILKIYSNQLWWRKECKIVKLER